MIIILNTSDFISDFICLTLTPWALFLNNKNPTKSNKIQQLPLLFQELGLISKEWQKNQSLLLNVLLLTSTFEIITVGRLIE